GPGGPRRVLRRSRGRSWRRTPAGVSGRSARRAAGKRNSRPAPRTSATVRTPATAPPETPRCPVPPPAPRDPCPAGDAPIARSRAGAAVRVPRSRRARSGGGAGRRAHPPAIRGQFQATRTGSAWSFLVGVVAQRAGQGEHKLRAARLAVARAHRAVMRLDRGTHDLQPQADSRSPLGRSEEHTSEL